MALTKNEETKETKVMVEEYTGKTLDDLENEMETPDLDVAPRIKAEQGGLTTSEGDDLGDEVIAELLSWNKLYVASSNDSSAEARKLTRYTHDPDIVIPDWEDPDTSMTAEEYIEHLKELGYENAKVKVYLELTVMVDDDIYVVQASPQSKKGFDLFRVMTNKKLKDGKITWSQATRIKISAKKTKLGKFSFTKMTFSLVD